MGKILNFRKKARPKPYEFMKRSLRNEEGEERCALLPLFAVG